MLKAIITAALTSTASSTYFYSCDEVAFCARYSTFQADQLKLTQQSEANPRFLWSQTNDGAQLQSYSVDATTLKTLHRQQFTFDLNLQSDLSDTIQARKLSASVQVYENGILRLHINEQGGVEQRFRVSQEPDFAVIDEQLQSMMSNYLLYNDRLHINTDVEGTQFIVNFSPFRIESYVDNQLVVTLNENDTLYFEQSTGKNADTCLSAQSDKNQYFYNQSSDQWQLSQDTASSPSYATQIDYQMAVGIGALFETKYLYGLSERESSLLLSETLTTDPYRFFNIDYYCHQKDDPRGEYGSIPYITGHSKTNDGSLLWVNSADTWTDLIPATEAGDQYFANFVSEAGQLELFLFSSNSPKTQLRTLAQITGYAPMPPIETLGFHFSKYADVSADIMLERDDDFESFGFPVDVYWMDILYAQNFEYFTFDPVKFPQDKLDQMNEQIAQRLRKLVVITDPHISTNETNFVYTEGLQLQADNLNTQIFVHDCNDEGFYGDCWPGNSTWVDYFNENAQTFWESLYRYDRFNGTTEIYSYWNDMNEPSVFGAEQQTLPLQSHHLKVDGTVIKHRDVHNIYGAMMHRTTHRGVLARDDGERRAFILTRSFFMGSQKYGAYWTGDNTATVEEVQGSIYTLLSSGLSGMFFGGSDIPGYQGVPSQDLYVQFYQLGMFYPFFRAHCSIDNTEREPWLQSQAVQDVIRETVFARYSLIHYLYTTFKQASEQGTPVMRPMFLEFPEDESLFGTATQFMFGESMLVSPKLSSPNANNLWEVTTTLPDSADWYNINTRMVDTRTESFTDEYTDLGMAVWIKAGSIIPVLNHQNELSLLRAINNPIRLEVYLDEEGSAAGTLVLDDGWSTKLDHSSFTLNYSIDNVLSYTTQETSTYVTEKRINEVVVYGFDSEPLSVENALTGEAIKFSYDYSTQLLSLTDLSFALDLNQGQQVSLLRVNKAQSIMQMIQ